MKYEALLAFDVPQYATVTTEAGSDEAAVEKAKAMLCDGTDYGFEEEFDSACEYRIVEINRADEERTEIAHEVYLENDPLLDNTFALLEAAKELLDICRYKCSPHDEVCLPSGKTNHQALVEACEIVNRCGGE